MVSGGYNMIKRILSAAAAAGIAVTAFVMPAQASTAARPVNWTQRTCDAFHAWQDHPTTRNLDTLVVDSLRLPHGYLAADVAQLLADSVTAKPKPHPVATDGEYVGQDCYGGL
jgi:hypothetical protein